MNVTTKQNREQNKLAVTNVYDPVQFNLADADSPAPTSLGVYDHAAHPAVGDTLTFKRQLKGLPCRLVV